MKKLLEVLQYGDGDIRFNTDVDVMKDPNQVLLITSQAAFSMMTSLWGGNERSVIAVIRALSIADLAVSADIGEMLDMMEESAMMLKSSFEEARRKFEKSGGKITTFGPGIIPNEKKS